MTTIARTPRTHDRDLLGPVVAASLGAAVFATAMVSGVVFELNSDGPDSAPVTLAELAAYAGLVLVGVALALGVAWWALRGDLRRLSQASVGLAIASAATFVGFWSGWPHVFAAVAIALALEHRRRVGGFSGATTTAVVLAALSLVASALVCVVG